MLQHVHSLVLDVFVAYDYEQQSRRFSPLAHLKREVFCSVCSYFVSCILSVQTSILFVTFFDPKALEWVWKVCVVSVQFLFWLVTREEGSKR